jgi:hypothetical protein
MHTIKINVSDRLYEKVISFLRTLPSKEIELQTPKEKSPQENTLVDFFHNSPLREISLERNQETYSERLSF